MLYKFNILLSQGVFFWVYLFSVVQHSITPWHFALFPPQLSAKQKSSLLFYGITLLLPLKPSLQPATGFQKKNETL